MSYEINILSNAERTLRKLPRPLQIRISAEIMKLADDPRPHGYIQLKGTEDGYRIRIGDYRVLYSIDDGIKIIAVFKIAHRKDAYRWSWQQKNRSATLDGVQGGLLIFLHWRSQRPAVWAIIAKMTRTPAENTFSANHLNRGK